MNETELIHKTKVIFDCATERFIKQKYFDENINLFLCGNAPFIFTDNKINT